MAWQFPMTKAEQRRGWVLLALYLFLFPSLSLWLQRLWMGLGEGFAAGSALVYNVLVLLLVGLVFYRYLRKELDTLLARPADNLSAMLLGFALWLVLTTAVSRIPLPLENLTPFQWRQEMIFAPKITLLLVVVLLPLIEEIFFRGLVFGALREKSRVLAYACSTLGFALASVLGYALSLRETLYLLNGVEYLPVGLALAWCRERGGSVWSAVVLRMVISAVVLLRLTA